MTEVKILIEGYAKEIENGWLASSTTTLIKLDDKNIVVDPGCNRQKLLDALSVNNLKTTNIDYVLLTHSHTDHILLDGIFENAKVVTSAEIYENDKQVDYEGEIPDLDIKTIKTPGHSSNSRAFVIKTNEGTYVVAGDVFWWTDIEEQKTDFESLMSHGDPYVENKTGIIESRKKVLAMADYIIPGHGKMWKVEK